MIEVEIYPNGWLYALKYKGFWLEVGIVLGQVRHRDWRGVRDFFHAYAAEHVGCPHRMGTGWTKNQAQRRTARICEELSR